MKNFRVIQSHEAEWAVIVNKSVAYDFYHTSCYHQLSNGQKQVLLVASIGKEFIALPLIIRSIPNTELYDCTSAYGYVGPITNILSYDNCSDLISHFSNCLKQYFQDNSIVSCFSRLHPITENYKLLQELGETVDVNKTISIDLTLPIEEQRRKFRKSNKYEINKLRKNNYKVVKATTNDEINEFIDIYIETMKRVNATDSYFFDQNYFYSFLNNSCFESKLLLAIKDDIITSGAIFTITKNIVQYHLAGTREAFIRETPMKLIIDEARLMSNNLKLDHLHLGGGVAGSDEDSLFRFKSGFSNKTHMFKVWKYIVNQTEYDKLCGQNKCDRNSNFFPLYRS